MIMNKNYYILYKVEYDTNTNVIKDIKYLYELNNYNDIASYLRITKHKVKSLINNNVNNFDKLKTYKDYTIIKE